MNKVLIPIDGSENAIRAVHYAVAMAKKNPESEFCLLHIVDPSEFIDDNPWTRNAIEKLTNEGRSKLSAAKRIFDEAGILCETELAVGNVRHDISSVARAKECDAIIMGTRGMSPIGSR